MHKCDEVWSYEEVRRLAVLTVEEMQYFEENLARLAAAEYCEFKSVSVPVTITLANDFISNAVVFFLVLFVLPLFNSVPDARPMWRERT